jgi:hypothetical protein
MGSRLFLCRQNRITAKRLEVGLAESVRRDKEKWATGRQPFRYPPEGPTTGKVWLPVI